MNDAAHRAGVIGTGSFLPDKIVDNRALAERYGCSEDWILTRTGIRERRFVENGTSSSDLGAEAARKALDAAGIGPEDLDLLICATYTPDMAFPSTACLIQDRIDARPAAAFDLQAACSGFVYALVTASQFVNAGGARYALVVGSDVNSKIVDPEDRKVTALFGDGAGAVVVGPVNGGGGMMSFHLGADEELILRVLDEDGTSTCLPAGPGSRPAERRWTRASTTSGWTVATCSASASRRWCDRRRRPWKVPASPWRMSISSSRTRPTSGSSAPVSIVWASPTIEPW